MFTGPNKFIFFILFVFSFQVFAQQRFEKGQDLAAFLYPENQVWKIKVNQYKMGWPELIQEKIFSTEYQATQYLKENQFIQRFVDFSLETNERELRESSKEMIWVPKNTWSWEWELKFAEWIQNEVDVDFFQKNKIATDCADVMYGLRWIFSRINYLPAANRIMDNVYFTNRSLKDEWKSLPTHAEWQKDKRFLKALNFIMSQTYTHTLYKDAYPIALNTEAIWPGAFNLIVHKKSGHTMVIYRRFPASDGVKVSIFASTIPKQVRILSESRLYPATYKQNEIAILRMRWPTFNGDKVGLVNSEQMPFYSTEQFSGAVTNINRILNPNPNWKIEYEDLISSIKKLLEQRKVVVEEGFKACFPDKCKPDSVEYENYSTPNRDQRLAQAFHLLYQEVSSEDYPDLEVRNKTEVIFEIFNVKLTFDEALFFVGAPFFSSDPNHSIERRWIVGGKNFIDSGVQYFQEEIIKRRKKINDIAKLCATPAQKEKCAGGTDNYAKLSLYSEQSTLDYAKNSFINYKQKYPESSTIIDATFESTVLSDGRQQMSLMKWVDFVRRAASHPQADLALFEGQYSDQFEKVILPIGRTTEQSGMYLKVIGEGEMVQIWRLEKGSDRHRVRRIYFKSEDEVIFYSSLSENKVIVLSNEEAYLFKIDTQEMVLQFPKDLVKPIDALTFYSDKLLIQTYNYPAGDYTLLKNVVFNLVDKKVIYASDEKEPITGFQVSKNMKYASVTYKQPAADGNARYRIYDLQKPDQPLLEVTGSIPSLVNIENIVVKEDKILFVGQDFFAIYKVQEKLLVSYYLRLWTKDKKKALWFDQQPDKVIFKSIELNQNDISVKEEALFQNTYGEHGYEVVFDNTFTVFKTKENEAETVSIIAKENSFSVVKANIKNLKIQETQNYKVFLNYENKKFISRVEDLNGNVFAHISGILTGKLTPEINHPENFLFSPPEDYTLGPISTQNTQQILTGSYNYSISSAGYLIFEGNELYISK